MFEELKNIQASKKDIRSFGITFGIILLIVAIVLFYYKVLKFIYIKLNAKN